MKFLMRTALVVLLAKFFFALPALGQSILPSLMYGVYGLDDSCAIDSRRLIVTPTDILIADPGLDIRIAYPDQRQISGDSVTLAGNFFVSVLYDGAIKRTEDGAVMSFNFPNLSFPLLEPIMKSVLGEDIPDSIQVDLTLTDLGDQVTMTLGSDDPVFGERLSGVIGTWTFDENQITRTLDQSSSVYLRCFDGRDAGAQHSSLIGGKTGIYGPGSSCSANDDLFVIANDGWGIAIPFADPTIGFAFVQEGDDLLGELYRAPFAPLAAGENSYIDIEVRDGVPNHRLSFSGDGFVWIKSRGNGEYEEFGSYSKCLDVADASFAEAMAMAETL